MAIKRSVELKRVIVQIVCNVENQVESGEGEKKREKTDEKKMSKMKKFYNLRARPGYTDLAKFRNCRTHSLLLVI